MASGLYMLIFDAVYGSRTLSLLLCTLEYKLELKMLCIS